MSLHVRQNAYNVASMVSIEEFEGVPVLIHSRGYPELIDGDKVVNVYIDVNYLDDAWKSVGHVKDVYVVSAHSSWRYGVRETWEVGSAKSLEGARALFATAVEALELLPSWYDQERDLAVRYGPYGLISRADYEGLRARPGSNRSPTTR